MSADDPLHIEALSAVTLRTADMARAIRFYLAMGFGLRYEHPAASFASFQLGQGFLNLTTEGEAPHRWWGRVILHVNDVDAFYRRALSLGLHPHDVPRDAPWGERFFHITDPDGHELSFARPLSHR